MPAATKELTQAVIACPAGQFVRETRGGKGLGCHCAIAKELITAEENPGSLREFCTTDGDHKNCPIWRRSREAWWEDQHRALQRDLDLTAPPEDL